MPQNITDYLIRGSENALETTLYEDGVPITITPTRIDIDIGGLVTLSRTPPGSDGLDYASGVVSVTPADLTEDLSALVDTQLYRVKFVVYTVNQPQGVVFGGNDSDELIHWYVSTKP